jgi:predicted ATPase
MLLKNFKGWKETGEIFLAPITVFFGTNSSGKTSLLQSLLLLKQTAESTDRTRVLHPGDERTLVDLGTLSDFVYGHSAGTPLGFSLRWNLTEPIKLPGKQQPADMQFTIIATQGNEGQPFVSLMRYDFRDAHADMVLPQVLQTPEEYPPLVRFRRDDLRSVYIAMVRRAEESYELTCRGVSLKRRRGRVWPLPAPIRFYGFPDEVANYYQNAAWLADLALALERQLGRLHYVGPLREYPKRSYLWAGESPADVGVRGELTVPAILAARAENREIGRLKKERRRYARFEKVLAEWLQQMGIIESFRVEAVAKQRKDYEVRLRRTANAAEVLLPDVGFGVSQVLPVLVQSYYAAEHSTIIFEQPEIHLHPRVQADLADVFIDAMHSCKVQFIIETHSEHFLRRLQRRVAEGAISPDNVALYVCSTEEDHSQIEELNIDEFGNITNWPKDFFGDEIGDLAAMTQAAMKRRKAS